MKLKHPFNIAVIGAMGQGKTTFIKNLLSNYDPKNIIVFDPNSEYKEFSNNIFYDKEKFLKKVKKVKNKIVVFEEATAFFYGKNDDFINLLIRMRHLNVASIFVFHSIRSLPVFIFDFLNYMFIFKTNDRPSLILSKYKGVFTEKDLEKIQNLPKYKALTITLLG